MPTAPNSARTATEHASADDLDLAAADWAAELRGDELANISYRGVLLLRAIRVVVRDQDWRTIPPHRVQLSIADAGDESDHQRLAVQLEVRHRDRDVDYSWAGQITFGPDDLTVTMDGTANSTFLRNRIGIVVLHPLDDAGRLVGVTSPDGEYTEHDLPFDISPHQPLRNIRTLEWSTSGLAGRLELSGDVFETEDQRNWTDASFKTYSTPLSEPFPVRITAGQRIRQSARLTVEATTGRSDTRDVVTQIQQITVGAPRGHFPAVNFACTTDNSDPATRRDHAVDDGETPTANALLVEFDLRSSKWRKRLEWALAESAQWGAPLDVRLVTDQPRHIPTAVTDLIGAPVRRLGVFDATTHVTEQPLWDQLVYESSRLPGVSLVGGSRAHFAELNRCLTRLPADLPELTFSITPHMHAGEREHIVDSISGQRIVARNAVRLAGNRPVHIGPITLKPRFNAVATTQGEPVVPDGTESFDDRTDARQGTPFAAAWMLASAAALAIDGVASLTYFETTGPRGLRPNSDGRRYPVHRLAGWLTALPGSTKLDVAGDVPQGIHIIAASSGSQVVVLLSNLGRENHTLELVLPGHVVDAVRLAAGGGQESLVLTPGEAGGSQVSLQIRPDDVVRLTGRRS